MPDYNIGSIAGAQDPTEQKTVEEEIAELETELVGLEEENNKERHRHDVLSQMVCHQCRACG